MPCQLSHEVGKRVKRVRVAETFLVFTVAAFHLAVVPWGVRPYQFMPYTQPHRGSFKEGRRIPLTPGKAVGKLKTVVGLYAFNPDAFSGKIAMRFYQKIRGRIVALLIIGN